MKAELRSIERKIAVMETKLEHLKQVRNVMLGTAKPVTKLLKIRAKKLPYAGPSLDDVLSDMI